MPEIDWRIAWIPIAALAATVVFGIQKWCHDRRPDQFDWDIHGDYKLDIRKDRARFRELLEQQIPTEGATGIMVKVTFHGRSSIRITGLSIDWNDAPNYRTVPVEPITLNDGNTWKQLVFFNDLAMEQITAIAIHAEGGRTYRYEINPDYRHRLRSHTGEERP